MRSSSFRCYVPLLFLALSLTQGLSQAVVAAAECRLSTIGDESAERVVAGDAPGVWIWQARTGDELRCDADGFEPLDLWCGEGCGGEVRVSLLPARRVNLSAATNVQSVTVEWRRLGPPGESTQLLATRTIALVKGRSVIPLASGDDRVMRLRNEENAVDEPAVSAPQTLFVPRDDGTPVPELKVADSMAGGEIFGFLESAAEEPALLYLQGVSAPSFRVPLTLGAFGEFSLRGLADGVYRPRAVYPDGAASVGPEVEVVAGETAELIPWRVEKPEAPSEPQSEAVATLVGRVTIADDEPAADLHLEARPTDSGGPMEEAGRSDEARPTARTDAAGRFELTLPESGWWQLRFASPSGFPVREQDVQLTEGVNEQDFDLGDAARLVLQQQSERVAVVRMPDGSPATDVLVALDRRQVFPGRPGEFPLTSANELSQLRVLPDLDYVPVCRRVGDLERLEIDLQPATAEAVLVPSRDRMPPTGRYLGILEGLPGSDCPMPIALQWQPFRDEHGRDRILLRGLVPGVYTLNPLRGEPRELVVPGPPVPLGADAPPASEKD